MQTKIHFTTLVMLAHEAGQDRKAAMKVKGNCGFSLVEATGLPVTEEDMDHDLCILLGQLPFCRYVPAGWGLVLLQNAYATGAN